MQLGLVFTDDWELFGNGSGDIQERLIEPANRFMDISEKYGAKYTFMAEVSQYWSFKKMGEKFPELLSKTEKWEETIQAAIKRGHDVQLHLHPQWDGAAYENGVWKLNLDLWSLPSLEKEYIRSLVKRGKNTLEELLKPIKDDYKCSCFRSGAWLMQPSSVLVKVLFEEGILCDTSVLPGGCYSNIFGNYDYTTAYSNLFPWWVNQKDINLEEKNIEKQTITELPVYTETKHSPTLYTHMIKKYRDRKKWLEKIYPLSEQPGLKRKNPPPSLYTKCWNLFGGERLITLDHGQLSANHMLSMIKRIRKRALKSKNIDIQDSLFL